MINKATKESDKIDSFVVNIYGDIKFKGEIISQNKIKRGGRTYIILCVDIDTSNVQSYYRFDEYTAFKIENNIATLPNGFYNSDIYTCLRLY